MNGSVRVVDGRDAGRTVGDVVRRYFRQSGPAVKKLLASRRLWLDGKACANLGWRVRAGQRLEIKPLTANAKTPKSSHKIVGRSSRPSRPRADGLQIRIIFADEHIVVVDKPAGLTTVRHRDEAAEFGARARRFLPPTLVDLIPGLLPGRGRVRAVHRLDKETSGLLVLARTAAAERHLGLQFRGHTIERKYLAIVRGRARSERIESALVSDRGDGRRGSGTHGQHAVTHVRVDEELGDFTLVECRLETGRTHQVRIHLGERGTPLCGEAIYDRPLGGAPLPDPTAFSRPALHAAYLTIDHPATEKRMSWSAALPADMSNLHKRLRQNRGQA